MIDPTGKRSMSAMEELQAIARSASSDNVLRGCQCASCEARDDDDFAAWERELDTPTIRAALEYMEGEGA